MYNINYTKDTKHYHYCKQHGQESVKNFFRQIKRAGKKWKGIEGGEKLFAREPRGFSYPPPSRRRALDFSRISDKMSSSEVINILHNLTFGNFTDFFVGGARRRPSNGL